jgi:hypothetical protein
LFSFGFLLLASTKDFVFSLSISRVLFFNLQNGLGRKEGRKVGMGCSRIIGNYKKKLISA